MANTNEPHPNLSSNGARSELLPEKSHESHDGSVALAEPSAQPGQEAAAATTSAARTAPTPQSRKWLLRGAAVIAVLVVAYWFIPWLILALNTVSTDDAYVNSHVTFVAPRVAGQVMEVLVDDNLRVKKGSVLVRLDKEPYQVQLDIKKAAVETALADWVAAQAQVRSMVGQARANRFKLNHAIEDVKNQVANLKANVATLRSREAQWTLAKANLKRREGLIVTRTITQEELDDSRQQAQVAEALVEEAREKVYATRVNLGLLPKPEGGDLTEVPDDIYENFSTIRQALGDLLQSAAQFGFAPAKWDATPKEAIEGFYKQDPEGNLERIYAKIVKDAPAIQQAEAKLEQARRDLDQAELNLRYCDVVSEIDGVVTRRNVNPGNNAQVGQKLMAVRSLTEIWIDANFKETQLRDLRIGHRAVCEVDMYGRHRAFEGRITGFTMGTGQTLALLPPQNATGNFVKIVQRLPVRIELTDYDPDKEPLFVGLSVVPYVYFQEKPEGPHAGARLQPLKPLSQLDTGPKP
ncbi:MAG TPA: HlyD family secretion protein [Pirellulales bacterium]|nr:HlyD family secretion protein [Pirellulales bacterium]